MFAPRTWIAALVVIIAQSVLVGNVTASTGTHRFFITPGENGASCELAAEVPGLGTFAYCLVGPRHAVSVEMKASGTLSVCHGLRCMSNAPDGVATLPYGASIRVGPFRCTSQRVGVRCLVTKLSHGFLLGPDGLTRV